MVRWLAVTYIVLITISVLQDRPEFDGAGRAVSYVCGERAWPAVPLAGLSLLAAASTAIGCWALGSLLVPRGRA